MLFSELQDIPSAWPLEAKAVSMARRVQGFIDSASKTQTSKAASKWTQATLFLCLHLSIGYLWVRKQRSWHLVPSLHGK